MNKIITSALAVLILLSACSPSTNSVQTAIAQTQAAMPTSTNTPPPTLVPISEINIDPAIIQPEDLGLKGAEIQNTNPDIWPLRDVPNGGYHLSRKLIDQKGDFVGWVSIFVFESPQMAGLAFSLASTNVNKYKLNTKPTFAKKSVVYHEVLLRGIIFVSGRALISVALDDKSDDAIIYYAESLDKRLKPIIGE